MPWLNEDYENWSEAYAEDGCLLCENCEEHAHDHHEDGRCSGELRINRKPKKCLDGPDDKLFSEPKDIKIASKKG